MESLALVIAILTLSYLIWKTIEFLIGFKQLKNLNEQIILDKSKLPSLSIIVSALNEEQAIEGSLNSFKNIDYPNLEIIMMNDRSTDKTPEIIERFKSQYENLKVYHIDHLPDGWLGKSHALYFGSQQAKGEWLLFTDADVIMKPDLLLKSMSYVLERQLDHLTIFEHHIRKSFWLKIILLGHYINYSIVCTPWRIRYAWSKKSLGHGAFNLVNKKVYKACGDHRAIAMECLDDLKLGALIKAQGYRQDTVDGRDLIEREWYDSITAMIAGMEKNSFAFCEYQLGRVIVYNLFAVTFFLWPLFATVFFTGPLRWLNFANVSFTLFISMQVAAHFRMRKRYALLYPIAICDLLYSIWNSVFAFYKFKGVVWRGTHYSIRNLKK